MEYCEASIYEIIEEQLHDKAVEFGMDLVTVNSLIRSCVEPDNPELPRSSLVFRDMKKPNTSRSIKYKNIKVNLKLAMDIIFKFKSILSSRDAFLVVLLLDMIRMLVSASTVYLDEYMTLTIYAIYRLDYKNTGAEEEDILRYVKNNKPVDFIKEIDENNVKEALKKLEDIKCIMMIDGKYRLVETIIQ